jgi:hypothetical protein
MLVNLWKEVLGACFKAGLHVATVCVTGANNVNAMKKGLRISEETPFFRFGDQEIAVV